LNFEALFLAVFEAGTNVYHHDERGFSCERDTRRYVVLFTFGSNQTITLGSGYSAQVRMRTQLNLNEIEEQIRNPPAPAANQISTLTKLEILQMVMDAEDRLLEVVAEKAEVEAELEAAAPTVEAYELLHDVVDGSPRTPWSSSPRGSRRSNDTFPLSRRRLRPEPVDDEDNDQDVDPSDGGWGELRGNAIC
jgi:hypothetical protein